MSLFGKREQSFEEKFAHDEELKFKILAKRNALLGAWVTSLLGFGNAADQYGQALIELSVREPGEDALFRKVRAAFNVKVSDREIRRQMQDLLHRATEEVTKGT